MREARTELKRRQREKARMARLNAEAEDGGGDDDGDGERRRRRRQARRRWRRSPNRSFGDLHAQESLPSGPLHPGMRPRENDPTFTPTDNLCMNCFAGVIINPSCARGWYDACREIYLAGA